MTCTFYYFFGKDISKSNNLNYFSQIVKLFPPLHWNPWDKKKTMCLVHLHVSDPTKPQTKNIRLKICMSTYVNIKSGFLPVVYKKILCCIWFPLYVKSNISQKFNTQRGRAKNNYQVHWTNTATKYTGPHMPTKYTGPNTPSKCTVTEGKMERCWSKTK